MYLLRSLAMPATTRDLRVGVEGNKQGQEGLDGEGEGGVSGRLTVLQGGSFSMAGMSLLDWA